VEVIKKRLKYDFRLYKEKSLKNISVKKKMFEKGPCPHQNVEVAWFLPRDMPRNIKFLKFWKLFLKFKNIKNKKSEEKNIKYKKHFKNSEN